MLVWTECLSVSGERLSKYWWGESVYVLVGRDCLSVSEERVSKYKWLQSV